MLKKNDTSRIIFNNEDRDILQGSDGCNIRCVLQGTSINTT